MLRVNNNFGKLPEYMMNMQKRKEAERKQEEYLKYLLEVVPLGKREVP